MSVTYIPAALRRLVRARAGECCEYCRMSAAFAWLPHEVDHIKSEKHAGTTTGDNLCLSCYRCNSAKGSDIAGEDPLTGNATFLFHPRKQNWNEHFRLDGAVIQPLTSEARVTVFLFHLNDSERIDERELAIRLGAYPCPLPDE
jgi:hypothetical protein